MKCILLFILFCSDSSNLVRLAVARESSPSKDQITTSGQDQQQQQGTANHYIIRDEGDRPPQCTIQEQVMAVQWNSESDSYVPVHRGQEEEEVEDGGDEHHRLRHLHESTTTTSNTQKSILDLMHDDDDDDQKEDIPSWTTAIQVNYDNYRPEEGDRRRRRQLVLEPSEDSNTTFFVRACYCQDLERVYYCPIEMSLCRTIGRPDANANETTTRIGCFNPKPRMVQASETSFFVATVWFALLCWCIACVPCGRTVVHYLWDEYRPGHNERLIDHMMEHQRHRAFLLLRRGMYHHHQRWMYPSSFHGTADNVPNHNQHDDIKNNTSNALALRTRTIRTDPESRRDTTDHHHHGYHDDDDDEVENLDIQCIICFQPLQRGERVGDLSCGHVFHADCLKAWLKRRNTCPLCNATEVAQPCHHRPHNNDKSNNKPSSSSPSSRIRTQTQSTTASEEEEEGGGGGHDDEGGSGTDRMVGNVEEDPTPNLVLRTGREEEEEEEEEER